MTSPAADRLVTLEGGTNFRDLGGCPTTDGGLVRLGVVYRSAALHELTPADVALLERLELRVVYDLRRDDECERAPSVLPEGVRCERFPIGGTAAKIKDLTDLLLEGRLAEIPADFLERVYDALADAAAPTFGELLTRLAEPGGTPALIHCTAGKDRTGVAVALLLSVLGVDDAIVLDDYELSAVHYTEHQLVRLAPKLAEAGIGAERYRAVFGAPRHAMARLLDALRREHGSIAGYLRERGGVDDEVLVALRRVLVERRPGS